MSQNIKDEFLDKVIEQIQFKPDRNKVRQELEDHIEDKLEYQSLEESIDELGNPIEIGESLNDIHNPFIGRFWMVSRIILMVAIAFSIKFTVKELVNDETRVRQVIKDIGYTVNKDFEIKTISKDNVKHTVQVMTDSNGKDAIMWFLEVKGFKLNFMEENVEVFVNSTLQNYNDLRYENYKSLGDILYFQKLDYKLKGDEIIEVNSKTNSFEIERTK